MKLVRVVSARFSVVGVTTFTYLDDWLIHSATKKGVLASVSVVLSVSRHGVQDQFGQVCPHSRAEALLVLN